MIHMHCGEDDMSNNKGDVQEKGSVKENYCGWLSLPASYLFVQLLTNVCIESGGNRKTAFPNSYSYILVLLFQFPFEMKKMF